MKTITIEEVKGLLEKEDYDYLAIRLLQVTYNDYTKLWKENHIKILSFMLKRSSEKQNGTVFDLHTLTEVVDNDINADFEERVYFVVSQWVSGVIAFAKELFKTK